MKADCALCWHGADTQPLDKIGDRCDCGRVVFDVEKTAIGGVECRVVAVDARDCAEASESEL